MTVNLQPMSDPYLDLLKKCLTASIYEESAYMVVERSPRVGGSSLQPFRLLRRVLKNWVLAVADRRSFEILKKRPLDSTARELGQDWPWFGYTMIGIRRLSNIQACVEDILARNIPGDLVEAGVWRGGSTILMRAILKQHRVTDRKVWVADSFEGGMPKPNVTKYPMDAASADLSDHQIFKVSLEQVKENFARFGLLDGQVEFLKGWFCDTLPNAPIDRLALLRLDGDLYESTIDTLNALYDRVSPGGYVIVDDYYSWPSCQTAVNDFLAERSIAAQIRRVDWTGVYWQVPWTQEHA